MTGLQHVLSLPFLKEGSEGYKEKGSAVLQRFLAHPLKDRNPLPPGFERRPLPVHFTRHFGNR